MNHLQLSLRDDNHPPDLSRPLKGRAKFNRRSRRSRVFSLGRSPPSKLSLDPLANAIGSVPVTRLSGLFNPYWTIFPALSLGYSQRPLPGRGTFDAVNNPLRRLGVSDSKGGLDGWINQTVKDFVHALRRVRHACIKPP